MKHKHLTLFSILLFAFAFHSFAGNIDIKTAKNVGLNAYRENFLTVFSKEASNIFINEEFTIAENSDAIYYVFNTSNMGFVIVAATDIVHPILGYSFQSYYSKENLSPEFKYWMGLYQKQIANARELKLSATPEIEQEWNKYNVAPENFTPVKGTKDVAPLLASTWNQDCCYNALCPVDAASPACGRCYVGCVATSMAQVMYYWRYPATGQGSNSYTPWGTSYGTQTANFGATTYDWNAMTNFCSGTNNAIATLSYHCGVAVEMGYGPDGSGANTGDWVSALPAYFKYSSSIDEAQMSSYSTTTWQSMIRTQLDAKKPIVYTGYEAGAGGHAWNCDGYQGTDYFHFNWGWGGYYDGYFYLDNLNPGSNNFSEYQSMVYNIYPGTGYPSYCSAGPGTLISETGTLVDGSGINDYQNNADCSWLIAPTTNIDHLTIKFLSLETEASNDVVTIYDGSTTSDPVLGTYSGTTLPSQVVTTGPTALVRFTTNGSTTDAGWMLSYTSSLPVYCSGVTPLTAPSGTIEDGSGTNEYSNSANCSWEITPTSASSVTLHFNSFDLETSYDKVRVIDMESTTLLGTYSGNTIPADVTSPSGKMRVIFTSNSSVTAGGFSATYSSIVGVDEYNTLQNLNVYPNPANDLLHISFGVNGKSDVSVQLIDLKGQVVYEENSNDNSLFNADVNISTMASGIYNLRIVTSGETVNEKVIIE